MSQPFSPVSKSARNSYLLLVTDTEMVVSLVFVALPVDALPAFLLCSTEALPVVAVWVVVFVTVTSLSVMTLTLLLFFLPLATSTQLPQSWLSRVTDM